MRTLLLEYGGMAVDIRYKLARTEVQIHSMLDLAEDAYITPDNLLYSIMEMQLLDHLDDSGEPAQVNHVQ